MLGRLQGDRIEMRDVDDGSDCRHGERTRRIRVPRMLLPVTRVAAVPAWPRGRLDDRGLVRAEPQLQAVGLA